MDKEPNFPAERLEAAERARRDYIPKKTSVNDLIDPDASMLAASFKLAFANLVDDHARLGLPALAALTYEQAQGLQAMAMLPPREASPLSPMDQAVLEALTRIVNNWKIADDSAVGD